MGNPEMEDSDHESEDNCKVCVRRRLKMEEEMQDGNA
jgi:hypothetical protein